jgi:Reverse transcriptase (RNA-dependent DNA polymerase)
MAVELGGVPYTWRFIQADVKFPILGIDFMRQFQLIIDVVGSQLLHRAHVATAVPAAGQTGQVSSVVAASPPSASPPSASPPSTSTPSSSSPSPAPKPPPAVVPLGGMSFPDVLAEFRGVQQLAVGVAPPSLGVEHHIITKGPPATAKFRRLDPTRLAAAKAEFQQMLAAGVVRRSSSSWASPLHMVCKNDGGWRLCGDFRLLNAQIADDKYPLPNMGDVAGRLDGCTIFTKLDLQKGYFQVPVAPADITKTAVITPFGLFEFVRMPFGLKNAGMTFQRLMDRVMFDIPYVFVYLDDIYLLHS